MNQTNVLERSEDSALNVVVATENIIKDLMKERYPLNEGFVHLHVHSEASFLDGTCNPEKLAKKCIETNMPMVITDHGNVCISVRAYESAQKVLNSVNKERKEKGLPPVNLDYIRGIEIYLEKNDGDGEDDDYEGKYYHLILLPYSQEGFENINYLSSLGFLEGLTTVAGRPVPVVKRKYLSENAKGLVATSACMYGECSSSVWNKYPYLRLMDAINGQASKFLRIAKKEIAKRVYKGKKDDFVEALSEEEVIRIIYKRKKLRKLKNYLFRICSMATNELIVDVVKDDSGFIDNVAESIDYYENIFDYFYLEVQDHGFFEQRLTTLIFKYLSENEIVKSSLLVTNDSHYIEKEDWELQDTLMCINLGRQINDPDRWKFEEHELYFKSYEELHDNCFSYLPEKERVRYLNNTLEVANICLQYSIDLHTMYYPKFEIPEGFKNADEYILYETIEGGKQLSAIMGSDFRYRIFKLIDYNDALKIINEEVDFDMAMEYVKDSKKQKLIMGLIKDGIDSASEKIFKSSLEKNHLSLEKLSNRQRERYLKALNRVVYEYCIIRIKEISDYFLIVRKIIQISRENDIMVGPGRGSAAGSAVSFLLGITQLDPMDYDLLFEREDVALRTA